MELLVHLAAGVVGGIVILGGLSTASKLFPGAMEKASILETQLMTSEVNLSTEEKPVEKELSEDEQRKQELELKKTREEFEARREYFKSVGVDMEKITRLMDEFEKEDSKGIPVTRLVSYMFRIVLVVGISIAVALIYRRHGNYLLSSMFNQDGSNSDMSHSEL